MNIKEKFVNNDKLDLETATPQQYQHFGFFTELVNKANKATNSDKAKQIRKKLLVFGGIGLGVSVLLIIGGMIMFIAGPMSTINIHSMEIPVGMIIGGLVMFMFGGMGVAICSMAIRAGLAIVIAGVATEFIDNSKYCQNCGDRIESDEMFCNKCGENLRANKLCACGMQNEIDDEFCRKCGKKLFNKKI